MTATKTIPRFLSAYDHANRKHAPAGWKYEYEYGYEINKQGQKVLAKTGEVNVYDKIQEHLEETKIENIMARAAAGDNTVFRPDGVYQDTTTMPKNLIEARQQILALENTWASLPREIKQKYNNDVEMFVGSAGTTEWMKDMGLIKEDEAPKKPEAQKTPEPKGEEKE